MPTPPLPVLRVEGWTGLSGAVRPGLEEILPGFLPARRWFGSKARAIARVVVEETIPVPAGGPLPHPWIALVRVLYSAGAPERYVLPLAVREAARPGGEPVALLRGTAPEAAGPGSGDLVLADGPSDPTFLRSLLEAIAGRRELRGAAGSLSAWPSSRFEAMEGSRARGIRPPSARSSRTPPSATAGGSS